jgi:hypothetical protein
MVNKVSKVTSSSKSNSGASERKMNTKTLSDDELQSLFETVWAEQVGSWNKIEEFEAKCIREIGSGVIKMEVTIQGLAGTPTADDFKKGKVVNAKVVKISRDDKGSLEFNLVPSQTVYMNSTEYIVVYQSA